jgi:outer membrane protein assembly factor BamB
LTELARTWPPEGPPVLWKLQVGEGHGGAAILGGRVYLHDYDAQRRAEVIRCLSLASGRDIWQYAYRLRVKRTHGVSRTVPAVTDKHLVALGPKCHVTCLDANSGELRWQIDLVRQYGTKVPPWYAGQCPLIDDGNAILAVGGNLTEDLDANAQPVLRGRDVLMTAVNCQTGKVVWEVPNPRGWQMTHSSVAVMEMEDYTKAYVYCASGGVLAVAAQDGKVLWETGDWKIRIANVPTPVRIGGDCLFLCGGYGAGCMMLQVVKEADRHVPKVLFRRPPSVFGAQQQTPIYYKSHLFGVRPDEQFVCLSTGGQVVWSSGPQHKFGKEGGAFLIADDLIFALDDEGWLTLLKATPQSYQPLARAKVLPGHDSWGPMALAAGRLICRDMDHMVCLDVAKKK